MFPFSRLQAPLSSVDAEARFHSQLKTSTTSERSPAAETLVVLSIVKTAFKLAVLRRLALPSVSAGPNPDLSSGLMKANTHFCRLFPHRQLFPDLQHFRHGGRLNDSCCWESEVLFTPLRHVRAKITRKQDRKDFLIGDGDAISQKTPARSKVEDASASAPLCQW